ncbi:hypothetical protein XENOCAPTIV_002706 [Xenoophorus captivus]|uniref:SMB domain-containing protein n=1 Tax=Xenoophorus captivus TaxID=1517983 RepID=A0ABV0RBM1_9TELE
MVLCYLGQKHLVTGGCLGKCCRGRNMGCSTNDWRMDRAYGTCYCDEDCVNTKDCCFDYFTECPDDLSFVLWGPILAQDCVVSPWSFWSGCAKPCQPSVRVRVRHVEQQPVNSGDPCPLLEERAGFCVEFELESRTPHCTQQNQPHTRWMRYITEGFKVCVACEPPALRNSSCQGDGQESDK